MAKPMGRRGSWFAKWQGEDLPCVHEAYFVSVKGAKPRYIDQNVDTKPQWERLIEAIRTHKKVVLTSDKLDERGTPKERRAYLAIWRIDNVVYEHPVLTFDFVERLPDRFS